MDVAKIIEYGLKKRARDSEPSYADASSSRVTLIASDVIDNGTKIETAANCRRKKSISSVPAQRKTSVPFLLLVDVRRTNKNIV